MGKIMNPETVRLARAMKQAELPLRILALSTVLSIPASIPVGYFFGFGYGLAFLFGSQMLRRSVWAEIGQRTGNVCQECERSLL